MLIFSIVVIDFGFNLVGYGQINRLLHLTSVHVLNLKKNYLLREICHEL